MTPGKPVLIRDGGAWGDAENDAGNVTGIWRTNAGVTIPADAEGVPKGFGVFCGCKGESEGAIRAGEGLTGG